MGERGKGLLSHRWHSGEERLSQGFALYRPARCAQSRAPRGVHEATFPFSARHYAGSPRAGSFLLPERCGRPAHRPLAAVIDSRSVQ